MTRSGLAFAAASAAAGLVVGGIGIAVVGGQKSDPRSTRDNRRVAPHNVFVDLDDIAKSTKLAKATSIGWDYGGGSVIPNPVIARRSST
jgi:hypothetical protein